MDRNARNKAGLALRRFASGRWNYERFSSEVSLLVHDRDFRLRHKTYTHDVTVHKILDGVMEYCRDVEEETDFDELHGPDVFANENREKLARAVWRVPFGACRLARAVLFLQSDLEYEWPNHNLGALLLLVFSLGATKRLKSVNADDSVWPFLRRRDYERALRIPKFLIGRI